ncbi:MAG: hypothetical protein IKM48_03665 [Clostridia bacterium]|nr:hypothetical protein [Clostridia bacterium]
MEYWQKEGRIHAAVSGTEEYESWIDPLTVEDGCTCPYAKGGTSCKHTAALWIALEAGEVTWEMPDPVKVPPIERKPYNYPWLTAVDELSEDVLRRELMRLADQDDRLKERLVLLMAGRLPQDLAEKWRTDMFELSDEYADRIGYIERGLADDFFMDLHNLTKEKLSLLLKLSAFEDAFQVVRIAGEAAKRRPLYDGDLDQKILFADCCMEFLEEIAITAPNLKNEMLQWHLDFFNIYPGEYFFPIYEIKFEGGIPFYRLAEQKEDWKEAPQYGFQGHRYDPIEDHLDFKRIRRRVEQKAEDALGELAGRFGSCHALWYEMKKIFKDEYGFEWHSPVDMNPDVDYD